MIPPDGGLQHLVKPLLTMLCDSSPAVLLNVLSHLPIVLSRVSFDASNHRDIVNALIAMEDDSKRQWRIAVAIASALEAMADVVQSSYSPLLMILLYVSWSRCLILHTKTPGLLFGCCLMFTHVLPCE